MRPLLASIGNSQSNHPGTPFDFPSDILLLARAFSDSRAGKKKAGIDNSRTNGIEDSEAENVDAAEEKPSNKVLGGEATPTEAMDSWRSFKSKYFNKDSFSRKKLS